MVKPNTLNLNQRGCAATRVRTVATYRDGGRRTLHERAVDALARELAARGYAVERLARNRNVHLCVDGRFVAVHAARRHARLHRVRSHGRRYAYRYTTLFWNVEKRARRDARWRTPDAHAFWPAADPPALAYVVPAHALRAGLRTLQLLTPLRRGPRRAWLTRWADAWAAALPAPAGAVG